MKSFFALLTALTILNLLSNVSANFEDIWIAPAKDSDEIWNSEKVGNGLPNTYPGLKVRISQGFVNLVR